MRIMGPMRSFPGRAAVVKLRPPDWTFDEKEMTAAFGPRPKAIILNTPNNPRKSIQQGRTRIHPRLVHSLECLLHLPTKSTSTLFNDGAEHISMARVEACAITRYGQRHVETYAVTGWRVGWASLRRKQRRNPQGPRLPDRGAAAPLQQAGAMALRCRRAITINSRTTTLSAATACSRILEQAASDASNRARLLHHDRHFGFVIPMTFRSPNTLSKK